MKPGSSEWQKLITASKVAAILGVSPWDSPRSVWHQMHGDLPRDPQNEAQSRGHYLEPAILAWWRDRHGIKQVGVEMSHDYLNQPTYTLGTWAAATPDAAAILDGDLVVVDAKSTAYDDDWGDEGTDVIPAYYLTQLYFQMALSGAARAYVPIIGPRLRFAEYVVEANHEIQRDLIARMKAFYDTLAADVPPPLDNSVATFDAIRKVHPDIDKDAAVELTEAEAVELLEAVGGTSEAEARERLARSTVIDRMGNAQYAVTNGVRVARRQPNKSGVSFVPLPKNLPLITEAKDAVA